MTNRITDAKAERIVWVGSATNDGWHEPDIQSYAPIRCTSYGIPVRECDKSITLAGTVGEDQVCQTITIPKCAIISRKPFLEMILPDELIAGSAIEPEKAND